MTTHTTKMSLSIISLGMLLAVASPAICAEADGAGDGTRALLTLIPTWQKAVYLSLFLGGARLLLFKESTPQKKRMPDSATIIERMWRFVDDCVIGQKEKECSIELAGKDKLRIKEKIEARGVGGWCHKRWKEIVGLIAVPLLCSRYEFTFFLSG